MKCKQGFYVWQSTGMIWILEKTHWEESMVDTAGGRELAQGFRFQ